MDGVLKILLLATLILLVSAQTFDNYRSLSNDLRTHIDKALIKAHQEIAKKQHVAFYSLQGQPKLQEDNLYVNVFLQITTCPKTPNSRYEHRDECFTQKENTPLIDCVVCTTNYGKELVDCAWRYEVRNKRPDARNNCGKYLVGGSVALQKSNDNKDIGCIGCF